MSVKETCPGCDAHTSSVYAAFRDGDPCPYCGHEQAAQERARMALRDAVDDLEAMIESVRRAGVPEDEVSHLLAGLNAKQRPAEAGR
jgi:hypothetical protein